MLLGDLNLLLEPVVLLLEMTQAVLQKLLLSKLLLFEHGFLELAGRLHICGESFLLRRQRIQRKGAKAEEVTGQLLLSHLAAAISKGDNPGALT